MHIYTLAEVAQWLALPVPLPAVPIKAVVTDSRLVRGGELFVALTGERSDGHSFLEEVAKNGALAALVSSDYQGPDYGLIIIRVSHVLAALQEMARNRLKRLRLRIVAVTGSVGKTTTKEFIATLLSARYRVAKSPGNANSQVGVPTTILNICGDEEVLVLEMGMSNTGDIAKLIAIAPPEISVITTIGHSHAEFFEDGIDGIAAAKAEIYSHPTTKWGVANIRSKKFSPVLSVGFCQRAFIGESPEAEWRFTRESDGVRLTFGQKVSGLIRLPFQASHLIENFVLAAAVADIMGMSFEEIAAKSQELSTYKNRYEIIEKEGLVFLNDSYNASPESMRAALDNLPAKDGKAIAVLGEMKELGKYTESAHRDVAAHALDKIDHLLCYGAGCAPMVEVFLAAGKPVELYRDFTVLRKRVYELAVAGDLVLLKGSNSNQLWKILDQEDAIL